MALRFHERQESMNSPTADQQFGSKQGSRSLQGWVWLLVILGGCCLLSCMAVIGLLAYFGRYPENFTAEYSMPSIVNRGDTFDLVISMTNTGAETITVGDIDLDELYGGSILDGAIVLTTEPEMQRDYSLNGIKTFRYNRTIGPNETQTVVFHLQATTAGEFGGSIGIYVGNLSFQFSYVSLIVQE